MKGSKEIEILIVDDEENIVNFLKMGLESEGFKVYSTDNGKSAVEMAKKLRPDVVVLDIMLPELDGYEACNLIKKQINTNIIMLTARDDVEDRIKGLDLGADDYMIKPFSYRELVARIKARLRKNENVNEDEKDIFSLNDFLINNGAHEIKYKNRTLELSPTEYKLLEYLLENSGLVLSKSRILNKVWGYDFYGDENVVEVYIKYLRNKINDKEHKVIQTVRGVGYKVVINDESI